MAILAWLIAAEWLYVRALRVLASRGVAVPRGQVVLWHLGLGLQAVALLSPIGSLADELLSAHMAEHILLADLGAPLARRRRLRKAFRTLRKPLVALPVYTAVLYGWHLSFAFEGAVRNDVVHA